MSKSTTLSIKVRLYPLGDKDDVNHAYEYIRKGQYAQNRAYNILISHIYAAIYAGKPEEEIKEIYARGSRKAGSRLGSLYDGHDIDFPKGENITGNVYMKVRQDLQSAKARGLFKGKSSLPNKRLDAPLIIQGRSFSLYHGYGSDEELFQVLDDGSAPEVFIKFVNGIHFKVIFGNPKQSGRIISVFRKLFTGEYQKCGSSLQFDKTGKKIILNLTCKMPVKELELQEDCVVGVRYGFLSPIVCALNREGYGSMEEIGDQQEFIRMRTRIQEQRKREQTIANYNRGGRGCKKKLASMERFKRYEKERAKNYNHVLSRKIVDFAKKHKAKYIYMEDLSEIYHEDTFVLRNYNCYQLAQFVEYKAKMYGMEVKKVKRIPYGDMAENKTDADYARMVADSTEFVK